MQYFVQQLVNGLTLGSIYGLIAIGHTGMVYGSWAWINFAHGDVFIGAHRTHRLPDHRALFGALPVVVALLIMMIV